MKLPINCNVDYISNFLSKQEADTLYTLLIETYHISKEKLSNCINGKTIQTDSYKILFSTENLIKQNSHPEHIHGKVYPWTGIMEALKQRVEKLTGQTFEIAMCLYYPNGNYFAPYHFDQQTSGNKTILPSLSLGEVREFSFKENESSLEYSLNLANGSILIMKEYSQSRYTHSLLKNNKYKNGRINITFRESSFK
jgi:alkylated DNA repair dioxygenase AlkB